MAGWGLRVKNDAGSVQIDGTYKNLALISKGTFTTANGGFAANSYALTITGNNPVIALRCTVGYVIVYSMTKSGSSFTFNIFSSTLSASVTYYVFDEPSLALGSVPAGWGMRVRDTAGAVTFDSRLNYMRVTDFLTHGPGTPSPETFTYTSGRTYAALFAKPSLYIQSAGTPSGTFPTLLGGMGWKGITNGMECDDFQFMGGNAGAAISYVQGGATMILDVTDY